MGTIFLALPQVRRPEDLAPWSPLRPGLDATARTRPPPLVERLRADSALEPRSAPAPDEREGCLHNSWIGDLVTSRTAHVATRACRQ